MKIGDTVVFYHYDDEIFDDVKERNGEKAKIIEMSYDSDVDGDDIAIEFEDGETMNVSVEELEKV